MSRSIKHICFADDDPDDHLIFSTAVSEISPLIQLTPFFHCDDLVNYLNNESNPLPDVIFLDYNMPGNDGNACLQVIKMTARLLNVPVIIYSTGNYQPVIKKSLELGAYKYLLKPSGFEQVKSTISGVLAELQNLYD